MKIRLMGTEDDCRAVAARLGAIVDVLEVSQPRANRGDSRLVRMYAEASVSEHQPGRVVPWSTPEERAAASAAVDRMSADDKMLILHHLTGYAPAIVLEAIDSCGRGGTPA